KFRYVGSDWKVVKPKSRTRLEQDDQYADAMTGLIDAQQALLVAMENGISGHNNIEQIAHAYAMLCVGANAVAQLRELANSPREFRGVVGEIFGAQEGGLVAFSISIRAILVFTVLDLITIVAVALISTVLTVPTVLAIRNAVNTRVSMEVSIQSGSSEGMNDSGEQGVQKSERKSVEDEESLE
ncbi:MAG: hypothetical protein EZS28_047024, partial [Streblomastix strix]